MARKFLSMVCIPVLLAGCASTYETEIITKQAKLDAQATANEAQVDYAECYSPKFDSARDNCFRQIKNTHHARKGMGVSVTYANAYDAEATDLGFVVIANDLGVKCDGLAKGITVEDGRRRFQSRERIFHLNCKNGNTVSLAYDESGKTWRLIKEGKKDG